MDNKEPAMAPDPDEDDLSDLDDMLDEFSATKIDEKKSSTVPAAVPKAAPEITAEADMNEEDFAKQLQEGMAQLLGQFGSNPEMQSEIENMMKELSETVPQAQPTAAGASKAAQPSASASKKGGEDAFQDTIRKTMERMQASGETASAAAASSSEEDMLARMLKEMESGNFPGLDGGSEEDFNKMLMGMMEQLTNKDILYEPMKELQEKFPGWLAQNRDKTKAEDLQRYQDQQAIVGEIVTRFERKGYSDDNKEDREYIVERMQKMQAAGSPPPDLVGDMGSAQDMLGEMDGGCAPQ